MPDSRPGLARIIHESLLARPILPPGEAVLVRPPRRTVSMPVSASLASSLGRLLSRRPRDGIHEYSGPGRLVDRY